MLAKVPESTSQIVSVCASTCTGRLGHLILTTGLSPGQKYET